MIDEEKLLADLEAGEKANVHARDCEVCVALETMSDRVKEPVLRALAGTIGLQRLADILTDNGYPTGRRAIDKHRREGHTS
jgi:hypothetical protein